MDDAVRANGANDLRSALARWHADGATVRTGGRTARNGAAVMQAVLDVLGEVGYARLRVEDVAERAGVHKTTIYRRWGSKSGLVATALIERHAEMVPIPDTGDLRQDARIVIKRIWDGLRAPWVASLVSELAPRSGAEQAEGQDVRAVFDLLWPARFAQSRAIFERAIERGDLPADADPQFLIEALCGPLFYRWMFLGNEIDDAFLETAADLVVDGAGGTPRSR